jgi:hypothetical protein
MAITFFGVFKVCFFCEFKPVSAWAWFKKFGAKEHAKSVVLAFALKKKTLIRKPTMCTSFVLGKLWISPKSKLDNLR